MIPIYVEEIKTALYNRCYFPALSLALTLPDICGNAEYPNEDVGKRYITWYDTFLGENLINENEDNNGKPRLSGEVIYNLRNTFLHLGSPNVQTEKIKDSGNKIDKFVLILGDGKVFWESTLSVGPLRTTNNPDLDGLGYKVIIVDITYLCESICNCALEYYVNNENKFKFDFFAMTQEELLNPDRKDKNIFYDHDGIQGILNKKLEEKGSTWKITDLGSPDGFELNKSEITRKY